MRARCSRGTREASLRCVGDLCPSLPGEVLPCIRRRYSEVRCAKDIVFSICPSGLRLHVVYGEVYRGMGGRRGVFTKRRQVLEGLTRILLCRRVCQHENRREGEGRGVCDCYSLPKGSIVWSFELRQGGQVRGGKASAGRGWSCVCQCTNYQGGCD